MREEKNGIKDMENMSGEDAAIYRRAFEFLRAETDIGEVKSDPVYSEIDKAVKAMLGDHKKGRHSRETEKFICDNMNNEIREIKEEIKRKRLDEISSDWVREWHKKRQENGARTKEIQEFITESFKEAEKSDSTLPSAKKPLPGMSLIIRYVSAAAAILAGVIFVLTSLVHSGNSGRLFDKYYEPVPAVSRVTRGMDGEEATLWTEAVHSYSDGDFNSAVACFTELVSHDSSHIPPRFYLGMSYMGSGNYQEASRLLEEIAGGKMEYSTEATWYLGLIYLKEGEKEKAASCFKSLSGSPGYYSERSGKILRRLE